MMPTRSPLIDGRTLRGKYLCQNEAPFISAKISPPEATVPSTQTVVFAEYPWAYGKPAT